MVPVLRVLSDNQTRGRREIYDLVANFAQLSDVQRQETLNSGQLRYEGRVGWAITYLSKAGALERPLRARYAITDVGRTLLAQHPESIRASDLRLLDGFDDAWKKLPSETSSIALPVELSPTEMIEQGVSQVNRQVAAELLQRLHEGSPSFFEQAVVNLIVAMGYGGSDTSATRTQLSHDGGIDGIVDQDVLGLSRVYIQAKRYALDNNVQRPDIQSFVGALQGQQANQGVFITTGGFSAGARQYTQGISTRVVLIDGTRLANLMIRYRVGVQVTQNYQIVEVDEDFFE